MFKLLKSLALSKTSKDSFISLSGSASITIGGMLFTIVLARHLSPDNFGVLSALFAIATMMGNLSDLGISSALVNFLPKFPQDRHAIVSITFWIQTAFSIFLSLLVLLGIPFRHIFVPGASTTQIVLTALSVFLISLETFAISLQRAESRFLLSSVVMSIDTWGKFLAVLLLGSLSLLNIQTAIIAIIFSVSLATIISLNKELTHLRPLFPRDQVSKIFHFAKWIAVTRFFTTATTRIDVILLNALGTSFQAGIFAAASRLALVFAIIVSTLSSVIAPRFSIFTTLSQVKNYLKKLLLLTLGCLLILLITAAAAPLLVDFIFGKEYLQAVLVFQYLSVAMIPFILTLCTIPPLIYYFNQPSFVAIITVVQVLILIILDIILIPRYGALAPTYSLFISNLFLLVFSAKRLWSLLNKS